MKRSQSENETVLLLCSVLRTLMMTNKIEKISVNKIASLANIHRITFYYYFHDKYDLLHHLFEEDIKILERQNESENFSDFVVDVFRYLSENKKLCNNAFASSDYNALRGVYLRGTKEYFGLIIDKLSATSELKVKKEYIIDFYSQAATSFIISWLKDPNKENYELVAKQMIMMIEHGLLTSMGL